MNKERNEKFKDGLVRHGKIIFPIILVALVAITVLIALQLGKNRDLVAETNVIELPTAEETTEEEPELLQCNVYPDVNALVMNYYQAVVNGDVKTIEGLCNVVDDTEKIRIQELSKYIEGYPTVDVYTKSGAEEKSYIAYVYYLVKFNEYETTAPGIQTFYICTDENGNLFMNEGVVDSNVTEYIKKVNLDEDVVELFNKVAVEYNDLIVSEPSLSVFLQKLNSEMEISVGEALAAAEAGESQTSVEESTEVTNPEENSEETSEESETTESAETSFARTTTSVNVRKSDSENADKLGQISGGVKLEILEKKANGWCRISYEGKDAYVKTEYLSIIEDPTKIPVIGTLIAKDTVNVRMAPTTDSDRIGTTYTGEKLDLFEEVEDGWAKVKYNDSVGYVKEEYFDKE